MIEYHGWININESFNGEEENNIDKVLEEVNGLFDSCLSVNQFFLNKKLNYSNILHFGGAHNHKGKRFSDFLNLFRKVGEIARGSYGLLYVWDDEDVNNNNNFIVYVMTAGKVVETKDNLLSPCNPNIEGEKA